MKPPRGIDDNARWSASVHEAGHVEVCRAVGGTGRGRLDAGGRTGAWTGALPDRATALDEAAVHLAGGAAQRLLVGRDGPSRSDVTQADHALARTGHRRGEAQRLADRLVRRQRHRITDTATRLYRTGKT